MNENHNLPAFHFRVLFKGLEGISETDSGFQSVSGLKAIGETPGSAAANENKLAGTQFTPLILRRAVGNNNDSVLRQWILKCLNESSQDPLPEVLIEVLDEEHNPQIIFRLKTVTAAGWELGELNAQKSELLMEEISLHYKSIEVLPPASETI